MSSFVKHIRRQVAKRNAVAAVVILVVAAMGASLLIVSRAATVAPPLAGGYFNTGGPTPPGSAFPTDAQCAAQVHHSPWEPRADNTVANHTAPTNPGQLANFSQWSSTWNSTYKPRIDGNFQGTTDEIIQWVACKWGWPDEVIRAEAVVESTWHQSTAGDGGNSFGLLQIKWNFHPAGPAKGAAGSSWPNSANSTAYAVDQQVAEMRGCYDGMSTYLGNTTGDLWGCLQSWFSGAWSPGGGSYSDQVKANQSSKPWLSWADQSGSTGTNDTQAPTVSIPPPPPASTVSGTVTVSPNASDNIGVTKVELYIDGKLSSTINSPGPYNFAWDTTKVTNGSHSISAKAYDAANNAGTSATVTFNVQNADTQVPSAPPNVTATANAPSQVTVNWGASTDNSGIIANYYISRTTAGSTAATQIGPISGSATSYVDNTVSPSTAYSYQVWAVDPSGNRSLNSAAASATTPAAAGDTIVPVAAITTPTAGQVVTGSVNIVATATDNIGVTKVEFYVDGILAGTDTTSPYGLAWNANAVANGPHILKVIAYDASNNQGTAQVTISVNVPIAPLDAPTGVSATANSPSSVSVRWTGSTSTAVTGYYILRSTPGGIPTTLNQVSANTLSSTDTTAQPGTSYSYQVEAFDVANNVSIPSSAASVTTPPSPSAASSVRINTGGGSYTDGAGNVWSADQYFTGGQTDNQAVGHAIAGTTDDPLYQDERYGPMTYNIPLANGKYAVRLHFAEIYPGCQTAGCRTFNVTVNGTPFLTNFSIYSKIGAGYTADIEQTTATVANGSLAINFATIQGSNSPQIAAIEILPADITPPTAPSGLLATAVSSSQINLSWQAASDDIGVTAYQIFRNNSTVPVATIPAGTGSTISWGDTGLSASTTYSYSVIAVDGGGNPSPPSGSASATTLVAPQPAYGVLAGVVKTSNPANPYSCPSQPQLTQVNTTPPKGSTKYVCTQRVQWFLNLIAGAGLGVDGWYGRNTCAAVTNFKIRYGLPADCIFGPSAWAALNTYGAQTAPAAGARIAFITPNNVYHLVTADSQGGYNSGTIMAGSFNAGYTLQHYTAQSVPVTINGGQTTTKNVTLKHP